MKIKCPKCCTSYIIDGITKIFIRRSLRCSTCGHNWRQNLIPSKQNLTSKPLQHVFAPLNFQFLQNAHQTFYKPPSHATHETKDKFYSGNTNEHSSLERSSLPSESPSQSDNSSKSSLSQCVFCQRSSRCNLHDLYSGRRH